jgi:hypothetical protein
MGRNPVMYDAPYVAEYDIIARRNGGKAIEKSERHGHWIPDFEGRIPNEKYVPDSPVAGAPAPLFRHQLRYQSDITI